MEVGAGVGSLTVALAAAGCEVVAVELDRAILPALREVVAPWPNVRVVEADALRADWVELLGPGRWALVANLPYAISVPLTVDLLDRVPTIDPLVVMVQREVGDRLLARPGDEAYGPLGIRIAYHAEVRLDRRVPADVFWPRPKVDSVIARLTRREPPVDVDPVALFRVVDVAFAERRKTMVNALRRLDLDLREATQLCRASEVEPSDRPDRIDLGGFARITTALVARGWRP